jgi:predicted DNA-binding antitoxin AbrB/MazE fold protein
MTQQIDAIYDHGILRPVTPLDLPDQARVKVTVDAQMVGQSEPVSPHNAIADFDEELDGLLFDGPSLPADFSRTDIYADHD